MGKIGIYKITSPTGKVYIGQSWNINSRRSAYKTLKCNLQPKLYNSLKKYGWESHTFEIELILDGVATQPLMNKWEIWFYNYYLSKGTNMLNVRYPGSNGKFSEESKLKMSLVHKGVPLKSEHARRISEGNKGKRTGEKNHFFGGKYSKFGKDHPGSKSIHQYNKSGILLRSWDSIVEAANQLKLNKRAISACCMGHLKTSGGYRWTYKQKETC